MQRLRHFLFVRHGHNWLLLIRFGLVGGSGVFVNLLAVIIANKIGPTEQNVFFDLPMTDFNVRWYHVYSTIAFLVANLWNFQLNRRFTFKSAAHASWIREYLPFVAVGLLGQVIGLGILTLLLHPGSVFSLSPTFFDNSTGFRTRLYWAQLIMIAVVTPLSFVLNKVWTFSSVRGLVKQPTFEEEATAEARTERIDNLRARLAAAVEEIQQNRAAEAADVSDGHRPDVASPASDATAPSSSPATAPDRSVGGTPTR